MKSWIDQLVPIIEEFRDGEPCLDGDEVELLGEILKTKINLHEGNITEEEYERTVDKLITQERLSFPISKRIKEQMKDALKYAINELKEFGSKEAVNELKNEILEQVNEKDKQ